MRWNKGALRGTVRVFRFSLMQQMKSRVNQVMLLILFVVSAAAIPVMAFKLGKADGKTEVQRSELQRVYVKNDTFLEPELEMLGELEPALEFTEFSLTELALEDFELGENEAFAVFSADEQGYLLDLYTSEASEVPQEDMDILEAALLQAFEHAQITAAGASMETMRELELPLDIERLSWEEYMEPEETDWETQFALQYVYAILVIILCSMTSSYIVRSIAEEKSSRLVELLLVSVTPLSLLLGKVLAMMAYMLSMIAAVAAGAGLSWLVCGSFLDLSGISLTAVLGIAPGSLHLGAGLILIVIVCLLLGYLTFSLTAGLAGCCCSSMDDVERENVMVVLLIMAGYMVSSILGPFLSGFACTVVSLIPLVSVFCAPVQYALGNIGFGVLVLSWIAQAAVIAVLALISARVYRELILYKGSQVGLRRLLRMAGFGRGGND